MSAERTNFRIKELDALRGLAALSVLLYHYTVQPAFGISERVAAPFRFAWGDQGVALFFMISGFVIFMTLDRTTSVMDFVVGRFSRLFPAFWACLLITYGTVVLAGPPSLHVTPKAALWSATMMPRLLAHSPMVDGAYWSLEHELLFYAAMLVLYKFGALRRITPVLAVWLCAALCANVILNHWDATSLLYRLTGKVQAVTSLAYIHLFSIGIVLYDTKRKSVWTAGHVVVLILCAFLTFEIGSFPFPTLITMALPFFCYAAVSAHLPFLNYRPLLWLGSISYPLYLLHQNIGLIGLKKLQALHVSSLASLFIMTAVSLTLAHLVSSLIERPAMRWIRTRYKSSVMPSVPAPGFTTPAASTET